MAVVLVGDVRVGDELPHVSVLALEVEPAPHVPVVDLAVCPRSGAAAEGDALILDALQHRVKLLVRGQEGVVVGVRVIRVVEVERQRIVDLDRGEVAPGPVVLQSEDAGDELARILSCRRRARLCGPSLQWHGVPPYRPLVLVWVVAPAGSLSGLHSASGLPGVPTAAAPPANLDQHVP